ncbi:cupredoxin domain-containing protein [Candidatus Woesearchaeota archaeon]|nr:cupredoxin domain-containing protein [Candidatus Woesearchaeota archaeon]
MEQKQLDEMDESFFAEEYLEEEVVSEDFLDELDAKEASLKSKDNPFASAVTSSKKEEKIKPQVTAKKVKEAKAVKTATAKVEPKASVKLDVKKEKTEDVVITPVKTSAPKEEKKAVEKAVPELKMEPKTEKVAKYVEASPRVDPWADEKKETKPKVELKSADDRGLFKDASTWKALTGITIILLLFSVFTQGFQFPEKALSSAPLTLKEAETKTLAFVNENLLSPPYVAQVVKSAELEGLYQFTLSVAGQTVDSYLTKDGKLFFPQGLDTNLNLGSLSNTPQNAAPTDAVKPTETIPEEKKETVTEQPTTAPVTQPEATQTVEVRLAAKRWLFNPPAVSVKRGSSVIFNIVPDNVEFTFAIPQLGVQQEVRGPTKVKVSVPETGSFEYVCSSCEEWRGMKGTLMVE